MVFSKNINRAPDRIKAKLYRNYSPISGNRYIARANHEISLSIEQICSVLKNRGDFTGSYDNLVENVSQFFDEAVFHLCNGYAVNTGYFSIHPFISGTFDSVNDGYDWKKNPVSFRFRTRSKLRRLAENITVVIDGLANGSGNIYEFFDLDAESVNDMYVPGNQFIIYGDKIKIAGDDPNVGVFFVPVNNPSGAVRVACIAENSLNRITGIAPNAESSYSRIEIRTQHAGSSDKFLKTPRIITSSFIVEEFRQDLDSEIFDAFPAGAECGRLNEQPSGKPDDNCSSSRPSWNPVYPDRQWHRLPRAETGSAQ